jgi:D-glycero-alpha-D-manno-heptose-7-phosphate kinase
VIISRTPFRISFFGGGTDYPGYFRDHGGAVLSCSFDKYSYITCRHLPEFFDHKFRITYSKVEHVPDVRSIEHRAIRAVLSEMGVDNGCEIHCDADLPARSGLGSSSSFVVGLLHALSALKGQHVSKDWLAKEAIRIEQEVLEETVGVQDQTAAAFGGLNVLRFSPDGEIGVEPVVVSSDRKKEFNDHLMLFFTGFSRIASEIAKVKTKNISEKVADFDAIKLMVNEGLEVICSGNDIRTIGEMLHAAWLRKRSLASAVSNDQIDQLYERGRRAGAIGGKLLGAGGGGFMLLFVEPGKQKAVREALGELIHVPFEFESSGSQIIYYRP